MEILAPLFETYGLPGLIIAWFIWSQGKKEDRINDLTDKLLDKNEGDVERYTAQTMMMERTLMAVQSLQGVPKK